MAADCDRGDDFVTPGSESGSYGIGLSKFLTHGTVEIFATCRGFSHAEPTAACLDVPSVIFGLAETF